MAPWAQERAKSFGLGSSDASGGAGDHGNRVGVVGESVQELREECDQELGWRNHVRRWVKAGLLTWASPVLTSWSFCANKDRRLRASAILTWAAMSRRTVQGQEGDFDMDGSRWSGGVGSSARSGQGAVLVSRQHPRADPWDARGRWGSMCCCCIQSCCLGGTLPGRCPCWVSRWKRNAVETHWASRAGRSVHCVKWASMAVASCG